MAPDCLPVKSRVIDWPEPTITSPIAEFAFNPVMDTPIPYPKEEPPRSPRVTADEEVDPERVTEVILVSASVLKVNALPVETVSDSRLYQTSRVSVVSDVKVIAPAAVISRVLSAEVVAVPRSIPNAQVASWSVWETVKDVALGITKAAVFGVADAHC